MSSLEKLEKRLAAVEDIADDKDKKNELYNMEDEVNELLASLDSKEMSMSSEAYMLSEVAEHAELTEKDKLKLEKLGSDLKLIEIDIEKATSFKEKLQNVIVKYRAYNKYLCMNNIRYLLEKNDIGVGKLETQAHVRVGYMSRVERSGSSAEPSLQFVASAAKMFNVTVDELLYSNMEEISETEKYLIEFINKLIKDTRKEKIIWNKETEDELKGMKPDSDGYVSHPLLSYETFMDEDPNGYPEEFTGVVFTSNTFGVRTCINGTCYNLRLKNGTYLYVMNCSKTIHYVDDPDAYAKEIWIHVPGNNAEYLCSNVKDEVLSNCVNLLYGVIEEIMKHPVIKKNVKSIMDAFMNDDIKDDPIVIEDDDEDADNGLPFNF